MRRRVITENSALPLGFRVSKSRVLKLPIIKKHFFSPARAKTNKLWNSPNSLGNVTKGVDGSSSDGLFVGLQQFKQLKTDSHPFSRSHMFCPSVSNSAHEVNTILLYFLVPEDE